MSKLIDLTGKKFGKLTVIKRIDSKANEAIWLCRCECGGETTSRGNRLRKGECKSCNRCSKNQYKFYKNYCVGMTKCGTKFKIDLEDYEKVSKYNWFINGGYLYNNKVGAMHRFIMKPNKNEVVDHIKGDRTDNRKSKLRICNTMENCRNVNKKGYNWNERTGKYRARITVNKKTKELGYYNTEDEARLAYVKACIKYFGEFANKQVKIEYKRLNKKLKK